MVDKNDVLELAKRAVSIPYIYGHGDIGDTLIMMLQGTFTPDEAYENIELLIEHYEWSRDETERNIYKSGSI